MSVELSAAQHRANDPKLIATLAFSALSDKLPLCLPIPIDTPPSPKLHYRSDYVYLGYDDLTDPSNWASFSPFDLALRLIDFTSLEPFLAHIIYCPSAKGQQPFHPVSMFLLYSWRILNKWQRTETVRNLAKACYDDYRRRFGFVEGIYPTEGGLRYFETRLGSQRSHGLVTQTVNLAQRIGCISDESTQCGILGVDGMLHDAASRLRCSSVNESCYQPVPRQCKAKEEKGHKGCDCSERACDQVCQYATPRDPQARFVIYQGHNQTESPNALREPSRGKDKQPRGQRRYGYRSVCTRLIDPIRRTSWIMADGLLAANAPEDQLATSLMEDAVSSYGWVSWQFAVADAGEGREPFLSTAYRLGLRRVVGLRAADGDKDSDGWAIRGYDDKGIPVCAHNYRLRPNGWDNQRHRYKWCCRRNCERQTDRAAPDCPYRTEGAKHGLVKDVGLSFADGSNRLVRDVPYRSPSWKRLYGRGRNAAEERNSELEGWGLKRMLVYGWERTRAMITVADVWINLLTMIRLIREASLAAAGLSPPLGVLAVDV